jgi:hypothetical protein
MLRWSSKTKLELVDDARASTSKCSAFEIIDTLIGQNQGIVTADSTNNPSLSPPVSCAT